jgi:predicted ribosomally synthesized peptide with SipW-like signal peptide
MKKLGFIILAVVLALGAIGAGYAYWSQTMTINASAKVGTFDVNFKSVNLTESNAVGGATASIDSHNAKIGYFNVANAYPGYTATATFTVKNEGTIPVNISISKSGVDPNNRFSTPGNITNLAAGATATVAVTFTLDGSVTTVPPQGTQYNITYTLNVTQGVGLP